MLETLIKILVKKYNSCSILHYQYDSLQMIAASPERLIKLEHSALTCDAIGGTLLRDKQSENEDNHSSFLMDLESKESKKLLSEHNFIKTFIFNALEPLCHSLNIPLATSLMKLQNMYHLESVIKGQLNETYDIFDVIETLHLTPAIAGYPSQEAKKWLIEHEQYNRGWYTGAFGLISSNVDSHFEGELSVMLRCALIKKTSSNQLKINLFAGAGLVERSDPDIEWQETELKMQTIFELIENAVIDEKR